MSTITKERIELFIKSPLENGLTRGEQMELARIALASLEQNALSGNSPLIPGEVLSAIREVARIRADFDDFDGDRRGIGDCLDEAEQELIVTINKYASQLAVEPVVPAVLERLRTIVADPRALPRRKEWVSGQQYSYVLLENVEAMVDEACHAAMLQAEPVSNSDELPLDYLQGHKDGLEWAAQLAEANHPQTGDWLYDDPIDLARAIRKGPDMPTVQAGNYPVTPDSWISCSERMPDTKTAVLVAVEFDRKGDWRMKWATYIPGHPDANDGWIIPGASWKPSHWMPLPEPPQEVK
ncbi:DUF551 domain-containing protein [Escherichia coli]|nr:DUF551 domain-containing protein [Escherichia coli]